MCRLFASLLILFLVGCGPVPKPFQHNGKLDQSALVELDDAAGVAVLPVSGVGKGADGMLAAAIAAALRDNNVPASIGAANRSAKRLSGVVWAEPSSGGRQVLRFDWRVLGADGAVLAEVPQRLSVVTKAWDAVDPGTYAFVGGKVADELTEHLQQDYGEIGVYHEVDPRVVILEVSGAPGDGNRALRSAMIGALSNRRVKIFHDLTDQVPILISTVAVTPHEQKKGRPPADLVTIDWVVMSANGEEAGRMSQQNLVPRGRLDGRWGKIAFLAAEAAADDLSGLLRVLAQDAKNASLN